MASKKRQDDLTEYYRQIYDVLDEETTSNKFGNYVLNRVKSGQKVVSNKTMREVRNFDLSFLDVIESVYPSIQKIMKDPKKSIKYIEEIVAVEKARKINSDTVKHLSSHTQLIREVTNEGDVIPSKVQTSFAEEELAIYENRFIKSLVRRIEMFLERRFEVMSVSLDSFETEKLNVTNDFLLSGQQVKVSLDIEIKNDITVNAKHKNDQFERLVNIREMVQALKGTDFMRALAKAHDVLPPIMKTNIILHNPDFRQCYELWLYLDRLDGIATTVDIEEKTHKFNKAFEVDVNQIMTLAIATFLKNRDVDGIYASKVLANIKTPKVKDESGELIIDPTLEPTDEEIEDYKMNELLLSQTAEYFEASFEGFRKGGTPYSESLKVVYKQMLDMLDQIYPKCFGVTDEELDTKNIHEQLFYARRKALVLKTVRQQKQMNILRMSKEEKKYEQRIKELEKQIAEEEKLYQEVEKK